LKLGTLGRAHLAFRPACRRSAYPATAPAALIASTHPHSCRESHEFPFLNIDRR
jgi:hypothetical protein